jgi:hypothetical protein
MPKFEIETPLAVSPEQLSTDLLSMAGVNDELSPLLKMTAPQQWIEKPIFQWPVNIPLFSSTILLFGFIPIDVHRFKFTSVNTMGFKESSSTLFNSLWQHERSILSDGDGDGATIKDVVYYRSKLAVLGGLFKPVYRWIFIHRHKRIKFKYSESN